jgi:hypothetical protein
MVLLLIYVKSFIPAKFNERTMLAVVTQLFILVCCINSQAANYKYNTNKKTCKYNQNNNKLFMILLNSYTAQRETNDIPTKKLL